MLDDAEMLGRLVHLYGPERAEALGQEVPRLQRWTVPGFRPRFSDYVLEKHHSRKHGSKAYYGQK